MDKPLLSAFLAVILIGGLILANAARFGREIFLASAGYSSRDSASEHMVFSPETEDTSTEGLKLTGQVEV